MHDSTFVPRLRAVLVLVSCGVVACGESTGPQVSGAGSPAQTSAPDALTGAEPARPRSAPGTHHSPAPLTCPPKTTAFAPRAWVPPGPVHVAACTAAQIQVVANCSVSSDPSIVPACDAFWSADANQACLTCAYTSAGDPVHGPIFDDGTWVSINFPACVAAASGDRTPTGCAAKYEALIDCYDKACGHCDNDDAYWACTGAADDGMCSPFKAGWTCAGAYEATCTADTDINAATKIISLLCSN